MIADAEIIEPGTLAPIERESHQLADRAMAMVVSDQPSYDLACGLAKELANGFKIVDDALAPVVEKAYVAHKAACDLRNKLLAPLKAAKDFISRQLGDWDRKQRQARQEEEARINRKLQEEAEAKAKAEQAKAARLERLGLPAAAEELRQKPVEPPPTIRLPEPPKAKGMASRVDWKFRIVDASLIPREYLMPNEKAIGNTVRTGKGQVRIPGVEIYSEEKAVVRT